MRERLIRQLWLAAVVVAFCLPLFVGLGRTDLENDEAIYSYAVDSIVAQGRWLNPLSSPNDAEVFLEKPPLKFWIVAAPIAAGLLPLTEAGLRVWDALFGAIAFVYVFALGRRLSGPLCGFIAVLILVLYPPLLFTHGLRNNNMEAPLFLCYCGGIYHYLAWASTESARARRGHILAVYAFFFLGFMTKFVASFFLPIVLLAALAFDRQARGRARADLRVWIAGAVAFLAVAAPWFVYQTMREGSGFWRVLVTEHVYRRFTISLDKSHLQPWNFYLKFVFLELEDAGTVWTVLAGLVLLAVRTVIDRRRDQIIILAWFAVPIVLISMGSSKIHHYVYPFLPPLGLAAGYFVDTVLRVGRGYAVSTMAAVQQRVVGFSTRAGARYALLTLATVAVVIAVATLLMGPVEWKVGDTRLFRNSHVSRPLVAAMLFALLAGRGAVAARLLWPLTLVWLVIPLNAYENMWRRTMVEDHKLRNARECLTRVQNAERTAGHAGAGIYSIGEHRWFLHSYFYYFRHLGWEAVGDIDIRAVDAAMIDPGRQRPMLVDDQVFRAIRPRYRDTSVYRLPLPTALLLLPGPYAVCDTSTSGAER